MKSNRSSHVGQNIRFYRKQKGKTLQDLADAISKSRATMSKYESGQIVVDVEVLSDIAQALDVPVYCFLDTTKEPVDTTNLPWNDPSNNRFYFYTISDKSLQTVMPSYIELCKTEATDYMTLYFNATPEAMENATLVYTGTAIVTNDTLSFRCTNIDNILDQMYFTSSHHGINMNGILIGFWVGFTFESQSPVCMKAAISKSPITDTQRLLDMLTVTDDEVRYFKRRGRFLLIGEM